MPAEQMRWEPPIEAGLGQKPLLWRMGCWLATLAIALAVLQQWGWAAGVLLIALLLSFQYAHVRIRGREFRDDPGPSVEKMDAFAFLLHLVVWRAPVLVGDIVLTPVWNVLARLLDRDQKSPLAELRHVRARAQRARSVVIPPRPHERERAPAGGDDATWPPEDDDRDERPTYNAAPPGWSAADARTTFMRAPEQHGARSWARRILRGHW